MPSIKSKEYDISLVYMDEKCMYFIDKKLTDNLYGTSIKKRVKRLYQNPISQPIKN